MPDWSPDGTKIVYAEYHNDYRTDIRFIDVCSKVVSARARDDVVRTGETVKALVDLVSNLRADIAGIYVLVTVGEEWKQYLKDCISKYSFETLIELEIH